MDIKWSALTNFFGIFAVIELEKRVRTLENLVQLEFMNNEAHDDRVNNSVLPYYAVWNNFNRYQQGFMKKYDAISAKLY